MQEADLNASFRLDKLISLINNPSSERRERAIKLLLNKLELDLIPLNVLYGYYHHIIGESLNFLNQYHENAENKVKMSVLKILKMFTKDNGGKELLKQYGVLDFMSEYYDFNMNEGGQILGPYIKGIIEALIDSQQGTRVRNLIVADLEKKPVSVQARAVDFYHHRIIFTNLLDLYDDLLDPRFTEADVRLSDVDRGAIINITTQLKFLSKENLNLEHATVRGLLDLITNLPLEVYFSQFTELFYEICNILVSTSSTTLRLQIYSTLINNLIKNVSTRNFFETPNQSSKVQLEGFRGDVEQYPAIVKVPLDLKSAKLRFESIVECLLRFNLVFILNKEHSQAGYLFNKLFNTLKVQYSKTAAFSKIIIGYLEHLNNFYIKNGLLFKELRIDQIIISKHICEVVETLLTKTDEKIQQNLDLTNNWAINTLIPQLAALNLIPTNNFDRVTGLIKPINTNTYQKLYNIKLNREGSLHLDLAQTIFDGSTNISLQELISLIAKKAASCNKYKLVSQIHRLDETSIDNLLNLVIGVNFLLMEHKDKLSNVEASFREFNKEFIEIVSILQVQKKQETSTNHIFINKITAIIKNQSMTDFSSSVSISAPYILEHIFRSTQILNLIIQAAMETRDISLSDEPIVHLLNAVIEYFEDFEGIINYYSLCNFLQTSENHKAKALLEFIKSNNPAIRDITNFVYLFSYDPLKAAKAYEELMINSESRALGQNNKIDGRLFDKIINYDEKRLKIIPQHILLRSLTKKNGYLTNSDLKDLYEILNIFMNDTLRKQVRLDSLEQLYTIITTYAHNPELIELASCLVNIVVEKLPDEDDYDITLYYIKILNVFFLNFSYMKPLKVKILNNSCISRHRDNFGLFKRLLGYLIPSNDQNNTSILVFIQMIMLNCNNDIEKFRASINNEFKQLNDVNAPEQTDLKTVLTLKIFSYNINHYYNLFSESHTNFTELIYSIYNYDALLLSSLADVSTSQDPETFARKYLEVQVIHAGNQHNRTISHIHRFLQLNNSLALMVMFGLIKDFKSELFENYESIFNALLEMIVAGYSEASNQIATEVRSFAMMIDYFQDKAQELRFVRDLIVKFQREVHDYLLASMKTGAKKDDLYFIQQLCSFKSFKTNKFAQVAFSRADSIQFSVVVSIYCESSAALQSETFFLFLEKACEFMAINHKALFTAHNTLSQMLRAVNRLVREVTDMDIGFMFNFLAQVKRLLDSPILELRHLSFNLLYNLSRFIKPNNTELIKELLTRANMVLSELNKQESPKIVSINLALYARLLTLLEKSQTDLASVLQKLHIQIIKNGYSYDKQLLSNYLRLFSIGLKQHAIPNEEKMINEIMAKLDVGLDCQYSVYVVFCKEVLALLNDNIKVVSQKPTAVEKLLDMSALLTSEESFAKTFKDSKLQNETCFLLFFILSNIIQTSSQSILFIECIARYLKFAESSDIRIKSHVYNLFLNFISTKPTLIKSNKDLFEKSLILESIMQFIAFQMKENDFSSFDFILPCIFSQNESSKQLFVQKNIYCELKTYINKLLKSNDQKHILRLLRTLRYFFLPVGKQSSGSCDNDMWNDFLDLVYNTLKKLIESPDSQVYKPEMFKLLRNWYLNDNLSCYLEKLSQISKNTISNQIFDIFRSAKQFNTQEFVLVAKMIRKTVSSPVFRTAVYKNKILQSVTSILVNIYNKPGKKDQQKLILLLFDILYAYSYYKQSHEKIISSGQEFEALCHFSSQADNAYNNALVVSKNENTIKQGSKEDLENLFNWTIKFSKFWTKVVLTKSVKAMCLDNASLAAKLREKATMAVKVEELAIISQFFINLVYKDASAFNLFDKEEFKHEVETTRYDNQKKLDKFSLLSEDKKRENSKMFENCRKIEKNTRNLLNILSLN